MFVCRRNFSLFFQPFPMDDVFSSSNPSHSPLPGIFPKFTEAELSPELSPSQDWEKAEQPCKMAFLWCILYDVYFCILQQHNISEPCSVRCSLWALGPFLKTNCLLKYQHFSTGKKTITQLNFFLLWEYFFSFASNLNSNFAFQYLSHSHLYLPNTSVLINTLSSYQEYKILNMTQRGVPSTL